MAVRNRFTATCTGIRRVSGCDTALCATARPPGQLVTGTAPVRECLQRLQDLPLPPEDSPLDRDPMLLPGGTGNVGHGEGIKRGVGVAVGYKNLAYSEGFDDSSEAWVRVSIDREGPIAEGKTAAVEVGQGLDTIGAQIVRTERG